MLGAGGGVVGTPLVFEVLASLLCNLVCIPHLDNALDIFLSFSQFLQVESPGHGFLKVFLLITHDVSSSTSRHISSIFPVQRINLMVSKSLEILCSWVSSISLISWR